MTELLSNSAGSGVSPVRSVRLPGAGPCKCSRKTCWHQQGCRSTGAVKILRMADIEEERKYVTLCRECAAPSRRQRVA
ncbi:MAG TPA: hypothetical protein VGG21_03945 [Acidimicrobiales bacterium]|jgi:hypothetical protein